MTQRTTFTASHKIFYLLIVITVSIFSFNCTSFRWKPVIHTTERTPYIFDEANFIGTGLKYTGSGYLPRTCISNIKTETRGGELSFEFHNVDQTFKSSSVKTDYFVKESIKKSEEFNIRKKTPVSFLVIVNLKNRHSMIKEESVEFLPYVKDIIKSGNLTKFFEACGTDYVYSTRFNSRVRLFVTYYLEKGNDTEKLKKILKKRISEVSANSLQVKVFQDLLFSEDTYYSMEVGTDYFFMPVEFPLKKRHGEGIDGFLNRSVHSILNAGKGETTGYETMPWKMLDPLKKLGMDSSYIKLSESSDESIFKSLNALEVSVRNFNIKYFHVKKTALRVNNKTERIHVYNCLNQLIEARSRINWEQYYSCYKKASEEKSISLKDIPGCSVIVEYASIVENSRYCSNIPGTDKTETPAMLKEAYRPVQLTHFLVADPESVDRDYSGYRYNDEEQLKKLPDQVALGQQMDMTGKIYSGNCIDVKTLKPVDISEFRDYRITSNYYPYEIIKWPLWKKVLLFWKKKEPDRILYRGSFEIDGYSKRLATGFKLTGEAEKLAMENLSEFYNRCGTHYVSQVKHRRGFVYYFSFNRDDDDIKIKPYGLSEKKEPGPMGKIAPGKDKLAQPLQGMNKGGSCLSWLLPSMSPGDDPMKPKTVTAFFKNKKRIIELYRSDDKAVPSRLILEPWSEYFQVHRMLKPHQLDMIYAGKKNRTAFKSITDNRGNIYSGEVDGNIAEGEGSIIYSDGILYAGAFKDGKRWGMGTQVWPNNDRFTGMWEKDVRKGFGIYWWGNGDVYIGNFSDDYRNGYGDLYWKNGDVYKGEWKNNKKDGIGVFIWNDGDRYKGEFHNNRLTGNGQFMSNDEQKK